MLALLLILQSGLPTVGDTIWLERPVPVGPGYTVRPPVWEPSGSVELLGPPTLVTSGGQITLRYPVVAWDPGTLSVKIPGPLLVAPSGKVDSLPVQTVIIEVTSVLPKQAGAAKPPPQPPSALIHLARTSTLPLVMLGLVALALTLLFAAIWRRRGRHVPASDPVASKPPPVEKWARAGESRTVAAMAAGELRAAIASKLPDAHPALSRDALLAVLADHRPRWPLTRIGSAIAKLDSARFSPLAPDESLALHQEVVALTKAVRGDRS